MTQNSLSRIGCSILSTIILIAGLPATAGSPIWKLSDSDSTVYLGGSVHLLRERDLPIPERFDEVYRIADELVFEIDMETMLDPAMALEMRKLGSLPAGETLEDRIDPATVTRLREYLIGQGLPGGLFDSFTPGMAFLTLVSLEAQRVGAKPELGLEARFFQLAARDGKPSRGLETAKFQISRFDELGNEVVDEMINQSLDDVPNATELLDDIVTAWKSGEPEQLAEKIVESMAADSAVRQVLLTERNRSWITEIEESLAGQKTVFFLVGAAHLVGEDSVVALLREKGYVVSQLE